MKSGSHVKRMLVFALLGPPLGMAAGFFIILPMLSGFDFHTIEPIGFLVLMPASYVLGLLPALLTGLVDALLVDRGLGQGARVAGTAAAGFLIGFLPILGAILWGFAQGPFLLLFGIIGAVPAALCSWLTGWLDGRSADRADHDARTTGA
jgi:hypothetical protein